jgi:hypothetical protein
VNLIARLRALASPTKDAGEFQLTAHEVNIPAPAATELTEQEKELLRHQIAIKWDLIHRIEALKDAPEELTCALCQHSGPAPTFTPFESQCIFEGGAIVRHQCPECDVIFGSAPMLALSAEELTQEYEWHYRVFTEGDSTDQELRAFQALGPEKDKKYVNWGSGAWSNTIDVLRAEGWQVYGFEPHGSAVGGSDAILTTIEQLAQLQPQGIFSNNVLEHLRHPVEELQAMANLLPSDGLMSHATPCFEYRFEFTRFHLFFFLGRSRSLLARQAGLQIQDYQVEGDFMNLVLSKQ